MGQNLNFGANNWTCGHFLSYSNLFRCPDQGMTNNTNFYNAKNKFEITVVLRCRHCKKICHTTCFWVLHLCTHDLQIHYSLLLSYLSAWIRHKQMIHMLFYKDYTTILAYISIPVNFELKLKPLLQFTNLI